MNDTYNQLKQELSVFYPDVTDIELNEITSKLIDFFVKGVKVFLDILDDMRKEGKIEVHFLRENLILTKDSRGMDILFWNMCVLMANSYVLNLSDNVKRSLELNWSIGKCQSLAPIGYLNVRDNEGKADIIIDEERAPIVKKLFQEYSMGLHSLQSLWYLARELCLTSKEPNHFEKSPHYKKKTLISRNKIDDILKNSFYYGVMAINDWQKPHIHGAIITKTLFDKVQEVLKQKSNILSWNLLYKIALQISKKYLH